MDHRKFLQSLSPEQRKQLTEKSDAKGLMRLAQHWGLILVMVVLIIMKVSAWPILMLPLGVLLVFQFTLLHEAIHFTPFRTRWLNRLVAQFCAYCLLLPPDWFRYFHLEHHRHTHVVGKDPELASPKPQTMRQYYLYISGLPLWWGTVKTLWENARGQCIASYVPMSAHREIRQESIRMLVVYAGLFVISVVSENPVLLFIWLLPLLIGQPLLRMYLLAEHTECPHTQNMFSNTRTIYTTAFVRWLAWNMPYHSEHHSYAAVPFHHLPELNRLIKQYLESTSRGYGEFHRALRRKAYVE